MDEPFLLVKVGEDEPTDMRTIRVTVSPANASDKRVTWSSDNEEVATVDENGVVTGINGGTATITVTSVADSSKKATVHVVVGDLLVPAGGSIQEVIDEATEGQVIAVAPGEYKEQLVIEKKLTLLGPNAGIAGYSEDRLGEATITYPDDIEEIKDESLVYITADNVVVNGLSFYTDEAEAGSVVREIYFTGYDNVFINNRVKSYTDKVAVHFGIADSYKVGDTRYFNDIRENNGTIVKDNYIESTSSWSALYLQGRAGIVEGNIINGGNTALQIQPYWNFGDGTVKDNILYGYNLGIWHNRADFGSGAWTYEGNEVFATSPTNPSQPDSTKWRGIIVQSHGGEGWGGSQPTGGGILPKLTLKNNSIDGIDTIEKEKWNDSIGIYFYNNFQTTAEYTIEDNTFKNVKIGANNYYGNADLDEILEKNTFPEGSQVIGTQIKMPDNWGELVDTSWFDSSESSFTISTAAELAGLAELVNGGTDFYGKAINLDADIDLLNLEWIPIGTNVNPFRGDFNGADKEISNLKIDAPEAKNAGLFGYVTGGSLSCLKLKDVNISAKEAVGALVGNVRGLSEPISNVEGSFIDIQSTHWAGGLIGYSYTSVKDCFVNEANVTLTYDTEKNDNGDKAGGITGFQAEGNFYYENCRASNVEIIGVRDVGGLVGASQYNVHYINCHVAFSVIRADKTSFEHEQPYAGGLIGRAAGNITLYDCTATPGGIIDDEFVPGVIVNSYREGFAGELVGGPVGNVTIAKVLNSTQKKAYETIQAAIDNAQAGDTIEVIAGTYNESLIINKQLALKGLSLTGSPGSVLGGKITIEADDVTVVGFSILGNDTNIYVEVVGGRKCDLQQIFEGNTFPDGSQVIGNVIMIPEFKEDKAYNVITGDEYDTIQDAINNALPGHTILVGAGTYEENLAIDIPLALIGAGRDITTVQAVQGRNYKGGGNQSPVVMITGNEILDGIIISGFTFQGHIPEANPGNPTGVFNGWGNSGINGLSTHGILSFDMNDTSIWPPTERYNITITNNKFVYCGGVDLYNVTGFEISNNIMVRESHQIPYYVGDERYHDKANGGGIAYLSNCKDGLIENNEGYTPKDTGVITITGGSDIDVAGNCIIAAETLPGDTGFSCAGIRVWSNAQNIEVRENTVKGFIDDPEKQNYYGAAILVDNSSCEVTGNVLEDNDYGVMVGKTSVEQNVEFTGNTISGCALGVLLTDKCAETVPQVFSGNTFEDNAVHVQDDRTTTPDNYLEDLLENNTFPDGSQVIGSRIMVIEEGKAYNATTGNKYDTIQEAIDAAQAGETILVLSGTYDENITIKRSVKLHGANEGINPNKPDWTQAERKTETVLTGFITADVNVEHIEINGFKFTKGENGEGGALDFTLGGHSTVKIYNCIAEDTYANAEHRGSGFMYVTNHGTGSPRNGTVEFVNNRLINTHGSNAAGTSGVLIWNTDDIKANGNYFSRTDENTGMTSNAALNLLGQDGAMEIKDNCFEDLIIKLDGTNFAADSITGNIFTGREGKSNILEFTTIRTPEEIEFLAENNTYSPEGLGYVAMEPVRLGNKGYTTIQAAINAATDGDNIIKVYPGDYGTAPIEIVQKEGINITLQAVGDVDLKNQIKIDGEARYNGDESLTIKGFTFNFSDLSGEIITTFKSDNRIVNNNSTYVYAHNIFIEDCTFIGNPNADELDVVAVKAAAGGGHKNFEIRNCTGESLHSLAQLTSVNGLTVENCYVSKGESGLNLQNSLDISITNLNVDGTNYGVRAGDGKSTDLNDTTMTIKDSNLKALYPIWLRKGSPITIGIDNTSLEVVGGGKEINIDAGVTVTITKDGAYYVTTEAELRAALANANVDAIILGNDIQLSDYVSIGREVELDGNNKTIFGVQNSNQIVLLLQSNNINIKNVTVKSEHMNNDIYAGINIAGGYEGIVIDHVTLENIRYGVYANPVSKVTITNCIFRNLRNGIGIEGQGEITGNTFSFITNNYVENASSNLTNETIIADNDFDSIPEVDGINIKPGQK